MTADRAVLDRIYRRPEFIWGRIVDTVQEWLNRSLSFVFDEEGVVPWVALAVLVGIVAVLAFVLLRWRRLRLQRRQADTERMGRRPDRPSELEASAKALAAAGDWTGAIRQLLRAFVLTLDATGILPHDPARTNRELRRRLQRERNLEPALSRLISTAEAVTYAGETGSDTLWHEAETAYRTLVGQLRQGAEER